MMTLDRFRSLASLAALALVTLAGTAEAASRAHVAPIKQAIASHLNASGVVPPNAMLSWTPGNVRIRTRVVPGIAVSTFRDVKFSVPWGNSAVKGTAASETTTTTAVPLTTVSNIKVTSEPWLGAPR